MRNRPDQKSGGLEQIVEGPGAAGDFLSGFSAEQPVHDGQQIGAVGHLAKPFELSDLLDMVRVALKR